MEFFFAVFFLFFYYIRPQDWMVGLAGASLVKPIIALWILSLVLARSKQSPMPGVLRTPHDWIITIYLGYIVIFANASLLGVLPMFAFYALTVQSISTWDRLLKFLKYWTLALVIIAAIAILSIFGLDLTGAQDLEFTKMGRLAIDTWLHNNPNSLAHSIVVAIPVSYFLFFWKNTPLNRFVVFPTFLAIVFYCAWQTQSKGAYLVAGAMIVLALIIGKPKWLQAIAVSVAIMGGISALSFLPRMSDMNNLRADEGVQGRLLAWEMAKTAEANNHTGVGWKQFIAEFQWQDGMNIEWVTKATHSSYVQIGADLGRYGLFLYLAGIWCALHSLLILKSNDVVQERCRRALMILLLANVMSGWMINRQYHTEYFILLATVAAMHRLRKAEDLESEKSQAIEENEPDPESESSVKERFREAIETSPSPAFVPKLNQETLSRRPIWNRFGLIDLACCIGLTWLAFWTWDYVLANI